MAAGARERGRSEAFLEWLERWYEGLGEVPLARVIAEAGGAERTAVMVVDLLVGFCREGALASPRVGALVEGAAAFLTACYRAGIRRFVLNCDSHPTDSPEFAAFPPHCITGTREAEVVEEIAALPFLTEMTRIAKRSINVGLEPGFAAWQAANPQVQSWIVVGDCTDLCVYQAAMHLRLEANARGIERSVWVPAGLVDTYDLPVDAAAALGALPHDGELLHRLFLYHLAVNGVSIARRIVP
jgi:nicotinamidase-related amidase